MRRSASSSVAVPAAFLFALLLAGCAQQAGPPASTSGSPATSTTSATPSPTATASVWMKYTTMDGTLTFDLPAAWDVTEPAGELAEGGGTFAEISNAAGKTLASLRTNMATGSTCIDRYPYEVLESQELTALAQNGAAPRYVFETRGNATTPGPADTPAAAYGITSVPAPTGDSACYMFHFFTWPPNAAMFGAFYNPENNVTPGDASLPYLENAKLYMDTPEYRDIKRMITSLRPAS
ncbi:hypothetical protein [Arthrobacter sp. CJ23]|uniref:hypothetical protein n=1 Tax=Arthrobacter sp. CJ23 TaxID=2972479 RepID=UPI00215CAC65|nr:hypothetical protein [Arthrobacter sp. CJ23]UVJ40540.1 hypothetical protein NVV90_05035 [Arthrobacter sp. CJ23]